MPRKPVPALGMFDSAYSRTHKHLRYGCIAPFIHTTAIGSFRTSYAAHEAT